MGLWDYYGEFCYYSTNKIRFTQFYCGFSFRNGSLVRDTFKRVEGNNSWESFSELLESNPRGNFGNMGK